MKIAEITDQYDELLFAKSKSISCRTQGIKPAATTD